MPNALKCDLLCAEVLGSERLTGATLDRLSPKGGTGRRAPAFLEGKAVLTGWRVQQVVVNTIAATKE